MGKTVADIVVEIPGDASAFEFHQVGLLLPFEPALRVRFFESPYPGKWSHRAFFREVQIQF